MQLFFVDPRPDVEKVHEATSKGYGTKHPENIMGYAGFFLFTLPDVYISDAVEAALDAHPVMGPELMQLLERFKRDDYGSTPEFYCEDNTEERYCWGSSSWMFARYETYFGVVCYKAFLDMALLYFEGEDISAVKNAQDELVQENIRNWKEKTERRKENNE